MTQTIGYVPTRDEPHRLLKVFYYHNHGATRPLTR